MVKIDISKISITEIAWLTAAGYEIDYFENAKGALELWLKLYGKDCIDREKKIC